MMGWLTFLNPAFLWGALAASIPVIIHLINRRRARRVPFPTIQFVLRAERRVARKYRLKQWLLLALRTLILFLLTTALAEPVLQPDAGDLAEIHQARAVVLILDNTMSMAYQTAGTTYWDLAKEVSDLVLQELRPQDQGGVLPVVPTGEPPQALSADQAQLRQQAAALGRSEQPGGFVVPFQQAYALLKTSTAAKKEIVLVTDHTRTPWIGFEPAAFKVIDPQIGVTVLAVGPSGGASNATVREVRFEQPIAVAGVRTRLTANLVNFGTEERKQVPVRLLVDGKTMDQRLLDLPKGGATDIAFELTLESPGYHEGMIQLPGDPLPVDDHFYFSVPVSNPLRVLLVDGDPRTTLVASETFYLLHALHPDRAYRPGPMQSRVVPVEEAERLPLRDFDVVMLANVRQLSTTLRGHLAEFVNQGGGLWWFLGQQVDPTMYNRDLFDQGPALLPARLGALVNRTDNAPLTLQSGEATHPIFRSLLEPDRSSLWGTRVRRLFSTETNSLPPTTRILLALPDGQPLLLEGAAGQGRVLLFTSTGDADWNELAVTTHFLPLIQTGVTYLAHREAQERFARDTRVPQPIVLRWDANRPDAPVTIVDPQGKETRRFPQEQADQTQAESTATRITGFYRVRRAQQVDIVAVNNPLEESDITPIQSDELREKFPGSPFVWVDWEPGQPVRPPQVEPTSLAGWFLIGLLALMLVEGVVANRLR